MYAYAYSSHAPELAQANIITMKYHPLGHIKSAFVAYFSCRCRCWYTVAEDGRLWLSIMVAAYHWYHGFAAPLLSVEYALIVCVSYIVLLSGWSWDSGHSQFSGGVGLVAADNVYVSDVSVSYMRCSPVDVSDPCRVASVRSSEYGYGLRLIYYCGLVAARLLVVGEVLRHMWRSILMVSDMVSIAPTWRVMILWLIVLPGGYQEGDGACRVFGVGPIRPLHESSKNYLNYCCTGCCCWLVQCFWYGI